MMKKITTYKDMDIHLVTGEAVNNMFKWKEVYYVSKLDFSQPMNYFEIREKTLNDCKTQIDKYKG